MTKDFFDGVWTYRSFHKQTTPVDDFNQLRFGQGEMFFKPGLAEGVLSGQLAFRSSPPKKDDARLRLEGSVQTGNPFSVRFRGTGVEGTAAQGWIYDYVGYLVPNWPAGEDQKPALVGSVIRTAPHGNSPAGDVASFVAVQRDFLEPSHPGVIPLPQDVVKMLASRGHRLHHVVFHGVRNEWANLSSDKQDKIRTLGMQPGRTPRPSMNKNRDPIIDNGCGEDFLFMHRRMIAMVDGMMKPNGVPRWKTIPAPSPIVEPWDDGNNRLPTPGNADGYAVPPVWDTGNDVTSRRLASLKSDAFYWSRMRWWDRQFKDPQYLRTLRLDELGALLEYSVHNDMHMRWASMPRNPQTGKPEARREKDIRTLWDNPKYDYLGEFYSSHVHPVFWRLHGWIDDRIEDWFNAHEAAHPGEIERARVGGVVWFKKGKWVRNDDPWEAETDSPQSEGHHHDADGHSGPDIRKLTEVVRILYGPLVEDGAAEPTLRALAETQSEETPSHVTWF
jgi:hypothetical protein